MKKMIQICQIWKEFFFKSQNFYDKFQQVAKNIEGQDFNLYEGFLMEKMAQI